MKQGDEKFTILGTHAKLDEERNSAYPAEYLTSYYVPAVLSCVGTHR